VSKGRVYSSPIGEINDRAKVNKRRKGEGILSIKTRAYRAFKDNVSVCEGCGKKKLHNRINVYDGLFDSLLLCNRCVAQALVFSRANEEAVSEINQEW